MRAVILQPGYLPWLGFFDLMYKADTFVILDDVQFTVRDWRNRNRIKTPNGTLWLTIPVQAKHAREKLVTEVEIDNTQNWQKKHLKSLESFYKKTKYFNEIIELTYDLFDKSYRFLVDLDMVFIYEINQYLSLGTRILFSSEIGSTEEKDEKLLSICRHLNASHYLSGDVAKNYLREPIFLAEGISVEWHNYSHPYYNQQWIKEQGFISYLSVLDLLFNHGTESLAIITGKKIIPRPENITVRNANEL